MRNIRSEIPIAKEWLPPSEWLWRLEQKWIFEIQAKGVNDRPVAAIGACSKDLGLASFFANHAGLELKMQESNVLPCMYGFFDSYGSLRAQFEGLGKEMIDWCKAMAEARVFREELNSDRLQGISKRL